MLHDGIHVRRLQEDQPGSGGVSDSTCPFQRVRSGGPVEHACSKYAKT